MQDCRWSPKLYRHNQTRPAAVQDQMSNVQSDLANRADAGDANAKRALEAIRAMKSRR